jgi:hypothetical protein
MGEVINQIKAATKIVGFVVVARIHNTLEKSFGCCMVSHEPEVQILERSKNQMRTNHRGRTTLIKKPTKCTYHKCVNMFLYPLYIMPLINHKSRIIHSASTAHVTYQSSLIMTYSPPYFSIPYFLYKMVH